MKLLLMKGAPMEIGSVDGTPLQCAASRGSVETVKFLLEYEAQVGMHNPKLHSLLIIQVCITLGLSNL